MFRNFRDEASLPVLSKTPSVAKVQIPWSQPKLPLLLRMLPETRERTMHGTVWTVCLMHTVAHRNPRALYHWHFPLISFHFNIEKKFIVLKFVQCKTRHVNHTSASNSVTLRSFTSLSNQSPEPFASCKTQFPFPLNKNSPAYLPSHSNAQLLSLNTLRTLCRCHSSDVNPFMTGLFLLAQCLQDSSIQQCVCVEFSFSFKRLNDINGYLGCFHSCVNINNKCTGTC